MKLVKFLALSALFAASYSATEHSFAASDTAVNFVTAGGCPTWPYCRDVEISNETTLDNQLLMQTKVAAGGCPTWPYCRDVEVVDVDVVRMSSEKTLVMMKAV